jgi:hypothetical protein
VRGLLFRSFGEKKYQGKEIEERINKRRRKICTTYEYVVLAVKEGKRNVV